MASLSLRLGAWSDLVVAAIESTEHYATALKRCLLPTGLILLSLLVLPLLVASTAVYAALLVGRLLSYRRPSREAATVYAEPVTVYAVQVVQPGILVDVPPMLLTTDGADIETLDAPVAVSEPETPAIVAENAQYCAVKPKRVRKPAKDTRPVKSPRDTGVVRTVAACRQHSTEPVVGDEVERKDGGIGYKGMVGTVVEVSDLCRARVKWHTSADGSAIAPKKIRRTWVAFGSLSVVRAGDALAERLRATKPPV